MTLSNARLQYLLAQSPHFQARVQSLLCQIANQVLTETGVGAKHAERAAYAKQVVLNPTSAAMPACIYLAQSTNVQGTITMEDEGPRTSATDAALASQIATSWNVLAGIDTGS